MLFVVCLLGFGQFFEILSLLTLGNIPRLLDIKEHNTYLHEFIVIKNIYKLTNENSVQI